MDQANQLAPIEKVTSLPHLEAVRAYLSQDTALDVMALIDALSEEAVQSIRRDLVRAERLAVVLDWVSQCVEKPHATGKSLRVGAHILFAKGHSSEALLKYQQAVDHFEEGGEESEIARTMSSAIGALIYLGHYEKAMDWAQKAREIFDKLGDRLRLARLDQNLGNIFVRQDRFAEALEIYLRSYADMVQYGLPQDLAAFLLNMAICQMRLENYPKAMEFFQQAQMSCRQNSLSVLGAEVDHNLAQLYHLQGDLGRAVQVHTVARDQFEELGDEYHQGTSDLDLADLYYEMDQFDDAKRQATEALEIFERLDTGYEKAKALTILGMIASHRSDGQLALDLLTRAHDIFTQEKNRFWPPLVDFYKAIVLSQGGAQAEARRLCETAIRRLRSHAESERREWRGLFERYVSPQVANEIRDPRYVLSARECTATVLFSDIRGFTSLTAGKSPSDVLAWLNRYFTAMSRVVNEHGGFLNKFIGDGMLVVFGVLGSGGVKEDAILAVRTALALLAETEELNRASPAGEPRIEIGVGLHTGRLTAGNVGSRDRLEYSVIGETVNLAARLERLTRQFASNLIVSGDTAEFIKDDYDVEFLAKTSVRGLSYEVDVFGVREGKTNPSQQ